VLAAVADSVLAEDLAQGAGAVDLEDLAAVVAVLVDPYR
jgi:hypothetical protein